MPGTTSKGRRAASTAEADADVNLTLGPPSNRPELVRRAALLERLASTEWRVCVAVSPAGGGKSSLLSQWIHHDPRSAAWLSLRRRHNSVVALVSDLTAALHAAGVPGALEAAATAARATDPLRGVARLCRLLEASGQGWQLVLDDVHILDDAHALDAVVTLVDHLPSGSQLGLATRTAARLPLGRWATTNQLLELGLADLSLRRDEVSKLLGDLDLPDGPAEVDRILTATEGWPAGVYLSALSLRGGHEPSPAQPIDSRSVRSFLRTEVLSGMEPEALDLLIRTSIADAVSGPLADALTGRHDSATVLNRLATTNLMVIPIEGDPPWYRYHSLLRELLLREVSEKEPGAAELHLRAAAWYERAGAPVEAVEHALAGGDAEGAARLVLAIGLGKYRSGQTPQLLRWLNQLDAKTLARQPQLAMMATLLVAVEGDALEAIRWSVPALRQGRHALPADENGPDRALVRAVLCADGPAQMLADAEESLIAHDDAWPWRPMALVVAGAAAAMLDDEALALDRYLAVEHSSEVRLALARLIARAERALAAMGGRRWDEVEAILALDRRVVLDDPDLGRLAGVLWLVADARLAIHRGDLGSARERLLRAQAGRVMLSWALPWYAVRALTEMARAQLLVGDGRGARASLAQARETLVARPRLGRLAEAVSQVMSQADRALDAHGEASSLTRAELRLLPLLQSYLSFKELGERLGISGNTVKSEAMSVYAKLDASSRSEAVERAIELGLLEDIFA
jgi:LuxR family transcriptional regulator, maltose regulon positive regulatory protein